MWELVGVILVIIIPVGLHLVKRIRKVILWETISNTPLLSIDEAIRGNIQVLFDGKHVQDAQLIIVEIVNSGNVSVKSTDYHIPINLDFGENARILTAEVIETTPDSLGASINIKGTKVFLNPILLNKKDSITIKAIVGQFNDQFTVEGHIDGAEIRKSTKRNKIQDIRSSLTLFTIVALYGMFLLAVAGLLDRMKVEPVAVLLISSTLIIIGIILHYINIKKYLIR